jgi:serine/threonine-protein kinase
VIDSAHAAEAYDKLFPEPPKTSVYFGAAGLVWFFYRAAMLREEPQLLAMADLWFRKAADRVDSADSFGSPAGEASEESIGRTSLYLGHSGVHVLGTLVGQASGDFQMADHHLRSFTDGCRLDEPSLELLFGRSGLLVGGAMLVTALQWSKHFDSDNLAGLLTARANGLWKALHGQSVAASQETLPHLGMAHGWSGILYAQLLIQKVLGGVPSDEFHAALHDIAGRAEPNGRGVAWLGTLQHSDQVSETPTYAPGWCSGSSGYIYLWILAAEVTREARYLEMAEKAAWHVWEHPDRNANLCCGLTGRAFALLRYYRHTGEEVWLERAKRLAGMAIDYYRDTDTSDTRFFSLFRGGLGAALLAMELDFPERSVFPLFELEGWPRI